MYEKIVEFTCFFVLLPIKTKIHTAVSKRKTMNERIIKIDFSAFPTDERFAQIPYKVVCADNLDGELLASEDERAESFVAQVGMAMRFICIEGEIEIAIDLKRHTLRAGQTAMVFPGSFFKVERVAKGTRCIFIAISPDFVNFVSDVRTGIELGRKMKENPIYTPTQEDFEESVEIYRLLKRKLLKKDYRFKETVAKSYLRIIQCNVLQRFHEEGGRAALEKPMGRKEELFGLFLDQVKQYYMETRSIAFYAEKLHVTAKYLSSVVHEVSGTYAQDWVYQYVLLEAKSLLRTDGVSIKDVSIRLNFANQSFFAKFFKAHTGMTPKEYRAL